MASWLLRADSKESCADKGAEGTEPHPRLHVREVKGITDPAQFGDPHARVRHFAVDKTTVAPARHPDKTRMEQWSW